MVRTGIEPSGSRKARNCEGVWIMKLDGIGSLAGVQPGLGLARGPQAAATSSGVGFEQVLGQTVQRAFSSLQAGEAAAIQGLQGSMPESKVVEAIMDAQRTLQSALAIRDKAVSAWQEITRMAI